MPTLNEIRQKYPDYNDMSDQEFADKFHGKFYSDIPKEEYYKKIEFNPKEMSKQEKKSEGLLGQAGEIAQRYINEPVQNLLNQGDEISSGYLQGLANIGPGIYNLGAKAANLVPGVNVEEKKGYHFAPHTANAFVGEIGSFFGPGLLGKIPEIASIPSHLSRIPQVANALKKSKEIFGKAPNAIQKALEVGSSAGKNALTGAVMSPENQGLGALFGAGGTLAGYGLGKGFEKVNDFFKNPGLDTIEHMNYGDVAPAIEASQRLGTQLRPSEASGNPFTAGQEGRFTRTGAAAFENTKLGLERVQHEKSAINNFLNSIYDKSITSKNKIRNLYAKAYEHNLDENVVNALKESDPVIKNAFNEVKSDIAWQRKLKDVPENNYAYLDKIRKSISDKERSLLRSGEKSKAAEYTEARKELVKMMDQNSAVYKEARAESQKSIVRSEIQTKLKKDEVNGSEFFKKIIQNDDDYQKTLRSLRNAPEAQTMLKDMKAAWKNLINVEKPSSASYQSEKSLNQARGSLERIEQIWSNLTGKKKNVEAIKFIRSDAWVKKLKQAKGDKEKTNAIWEEIIGKMMPGTFSAASEQID